MASNDDHPWRLADRKSYQANRAKKGLEPAKAGRPKGSAKGVHTGGRGGCGEIPTKKLLEAFKKSGLSKCELARRLGLFRKIPNIWRINEVLGCVNVNGTGSPRKKVSYATAVRYAKAMDADFFELGL